MMSVKQEVRSTAQGYSDVLQAVESGETKCNQIRQEMEKTYLYRVFVFPDGSAYSEDSEKAGDIIFVPSGGVTENRYDPNAKTVRQAIAEKILRELYTRQHLLADQLTLHDLFTLVNIWATISPQEIKEALAMLVSAEFVANGHEAGFMVLTDIGRVEAELINAKLSLVAA